MKEQTPREITYLQRLAKNIDAGTSRATFKISPEVVEMTKAISGQGGSFNANLSEHIRALGIPLCVSKINFSEVCTNISEINSFKNIARYTKADTSSEIVETMISITTSWISAAYKDIDFFKENVCTAFEEKNQKISKTYALSLSTKKIIEFIAECINLNKSETFEFIIKYIYYKDHFSKLERAKKRYPVLLRMKNETSKLFNEIQRVEKEIEKLWDVEELDTEPAMGFGLIRIFNDEDYKTEGLEPIDVAINNIFCLRDEYHQHFHGEFLEALNREEKILVDAGFDLNDFSKEGDQS